MKTAIGIDLGSTNSCVTAYVNNKIEAIVNEEGDYITESRVFFSDKDDDIIVGKIAKDNNYPYNEIYDVKHFMGKKFDDVEDKMKKTYPFQLVKGKDDNVEIAIKNNFQYIYKTPEEISAKILEKLIEGASNRLQDDFNKEAVITVPVYFNTEQRAATKRAAEIAGLKVIGLLNEPTAAAIYYFQLNRNKSFKKNVVVYDFGGATFNISIIEMSNKKIKIKYVGSDTQLGGKNIDDRIFQKIKNLLRQKHGIKIDNKTTKAKELLNRCEEVKKQLSVRKSANIISNYSDAQGNPITFDLKREEFEQMNMDLFNKTIDILKSCLNEAKFKPEDIDDVLLVGGSSRIPKIQDLLENLFGPNKLGKECSIDEAVAMGAAFQANLLTKNPKNAIEDLIILPDVLSGSLGTDIEGGKMSVIIKNDTPLPVENTRRYKTVNDNQSSMLIRIFQGNNEDIAENEFVDEMCIDDLTRAPKGEVKIDVKFSVDPNGVLKVTATGKMSGIVKQLTVSLKKGNL